MKGKNREFSQQATNQLVAISGRKAIEELLRHKPHFCKLLNVQQGIKLDSSLISLARSAKVEIETVAKEELEELDSFHQGVALLIKPSEPIELEQLIKRSLSGTKRLAVLDCIVDPQNVGAIFRVTEAFGFDGLVITSDRSAPISHTVRKVSRGSSELLPFSKVKNLHRSLQQLKEAGYWIVGTGVDAGAQSLYRVDLPQPIAVVFGSEGSGMRELTKKSCDLVVSIPLAGKMESLNVSQAASIVLAEITRQGSK